MPRPRLSERLSRGAESALTLVSAPAGFGKTTLLTEWLAAGAGRRRGPRRGSRSTERDNDPGAVLDLPGRRAADGGARGRRERARAPAVARSRRSRRSSPPCSTTSAPSRTTSCWCSTTTTSSTRARSRTGWPSCWSTCPPQVHLVIASRADPALPLARLRARGELVEVRAADLRFTPDEAAAYLNEVMGLALTAQDVAALEGRTEGWIAALQLAALSMQGRDDVAGFIAGFAGDDRYIVDYLVEEVLQRQPDARPQLPAADLRPEPAERPAVRRRHRPGRRQGHAGGARAGEPVPGPARRPPPVVPLPPPLRRRAAGAPAGRAARPRPRPAPAGERLVRAERRAVRGDPPRAGRRGLRARGGPGRAGDPGAAPGPAGGHAAALARGAARRAVPGPARAQRRRTSGRSWSAGEVEGVEARLRDAERWLDADDATRTRRDGRRRRGGVPHAPGRDRDVPRRTRPWSAATSRAR